MVRQFGRQHALSEHLFELTGRSGFTKDRFGILVLYGGQQLEA